MRDIFFDLSLRSVRLNFLRSLLAAIGIVIGVVAISSMGMLGANMQLSVKQQLSTDVNTVIPGSSSLSRSISSICLARRLGSRPCAMATRRLWSVMAM